MEKLRGREFVVFDVETTGLSPFSGDRIVEIAALKITEDGIVDRFHSLIDPQREISMGAYMVNGISREMLSGAPLAGDVLPGFLDFVGTGCLVGHNVQFDLGFLSHELARIDRKLTEKTMVLDTLKMARALIPGLGSYRLWMVARSLGVDGTQAHRAMSDVEMTSAVFLKLLGLARDKRITNIQRFTCR